MGYRFAITELSLEDSVGNGEDLEIDFTMANLGVAPIYNKLDFNLILKNESDEYVINTNVDILKWFPGDNKESLTVTIPNQVKAGEYDLYVKIGGGDKPTVKLAMDVETYQDAHKLTTITVK